MRGHPVPRVLSGRGARVTRRCSHAALATSNACSMFSPVKVQFCFIWRNALLLGLGSVKGATNGGHLSTQNRTEPGGIPRNSWGGNEKLPSHHPQRLISRQRRLIKPDPCGRTSLIPSAVLVTFKSPATVAGWARAAPVPNALFTMLVWFTRLTRLPA